MPYSKQDLRQFGSDLSNTLANIGNTIKQNKINAAKQQILEKYNNPDGVFFNEDGSPKNPTEVGRLAFSDAMWLQSNGFKDEAKTLGEMTGEYLKSINQQESNKTYIKMLAPDLQSKLAGTDLQRTNVPDLVNKIPKNKESVKKVYRPYGFSTNDTYHIRTYNNETGKWDEEIIPVSPKRTINQFSGSTSSTINNISDPYDFVDGYDSNGKPIKIAVNKKNPNIQIELPNIQAKDVNKNNKKKDDDYNWNGGGD